jgi:hypothetical protein
MQGRRPVGAALENGKLLRLFGDFRDRLDGGRTGADLSDIESVEPPRGFGRD